MTTPKIKLELETTSRDGSVATHVSHEIDYVDLTKPGCLIYAIDEKVVSIPWWCIVKVVGECEDWRTIVDLEKGNKAAEEVLNIVAHFPLNSDSREVWRGEISKLTAAYRRYARLEPVPPLRKE